jgi:hypothetical protein
VPDDGPLTALFVGHGAPPTLDDARWLHSFITWSQDMRSPAPLAQTPECLLRQVSCTG